MPVYNVQLTEVFPDTGKRKYVYIETEHVDVYALAFDLRGGAVPCTKLLAQMRDNEMVVSKRYPFIITPAAVWTVEVPDKNFVEYVDGGGEQMKKT